MKKTVIFVLGLFACLFLFSAETSVHAEETKMELPEGIVYAGAAPTIDGVMNDVQDNANSGKQSADAALGIVQDIKVANKECETNKTVSFSIQITFLPTIWFLEL